LGCIGSLFSLDSAETTLSNDGSGAKLFELKSDPQMNRDVAASNPGVARRLFDDYVLGDAGGPLPTY
jgi:hypothetical protein